MLKKILNILKDNGDKTLYKINNNSITYGECYQKVIELAKSLKKQGTLPVILYGSKSINQFISILACVVSKRIYIPIDTCTPKNRITEIIKITNSNLIIKNENISFEKIECLTIDELNNKYKNIRIEKESTNKIAYIIFTSGTTGQPKGVPITYDNLENFILWITRQPELMKCEKMQVLSQASFSFDLSVMDIYFSIYKCCTINAVSQEDKHELSKLYEIINQNKIEFLISTPTFIKLLLMDKYFGCNNFPHIKYMFFCGETLEIELIKKIKNRFPKVKIINAYGPTEATCCVSLLEIQDNMLNEKITPVGKISTAAVDIFIENNEICLKGKSVFKGYLKSPNKIVNYKTGDLGYIKNDYLYCLGRKDRQIKYQGYRIELNDIENNLLKINGIKDAVVICKYKENTKIVKIIKAFITVEFDIDENLIKKELSRFIPKYMIPKTIIILKEMPINKNGKYDRKKLSEL
jgi:D-alanine--poly(phosphoribitol) ligase subunit 1